MSRKVRRVPYRLDAKNISHLPLDEIKKIIRGADSIVGEGGRNLLAKILKGSREKRVLELQLDKVPVYGCFKDSTIKQITEKIDWVILNGYLRIEYDYRLPLLYHTARGWEIAKKIRINEIIGQFDEMLESGVDYYNMRFLKDRNREMIFELLEKIKESKKREYIPLLEAWEKIDYKKVRNRIRSVIEELNKEN